MDRATRDGRTNRNEWNIFGRQDRQVNEISGKIELTKLNLDNDYKVMKLECERYGNILKQYEATWEAYRVINGTVIRLIEFMI